MKAYLVGGAVRNALLGRPVEERDYVVVGSTPEQMAEQGFRPVGKDFPVFIHPETGAEYALARTERKTGRGYKGFTFNADPGVTLAEDLMRRDFTVNAMARDPDSGELIDLYGGRNDCAGRTLRHVSEAFSEDPLRVLRAARFASELGMSIAPATEILLTEMVAGGELGDLSPERVFAELARGLGGSCPSVYVSLFRKWGVLRIVLPEADALFGVPQSPKSHPEGCAGTHALKVLETAAANYWGLDVRLAALLHDAGKAETPADKLPYHPGHEKRSAELAAEACDRLRMPKTLKAHIVAASAEHGVIHDFEKLSDEGILDLFMRTGALRSSDTLECVLALSTCDYTSHPLVDTFILHPAWRPLKRMLAAATSIDGRAAAAAQEDPAAGVRAARLAAIAQAREDMPVF